MTPELRANFTLNTDFAETEVDDRRVNLTRFPLRFPEKRDFFLDGSNFFNFSATGVTPFFSRRIGLDTEGNPQRIVYGVKADSETVQRILAEIEADTTNLVYKRVFELGYTNNPEVIPHLRKIAVEHEVSLARAAAISSIGILNASGEFEFLKNIYDTTQKIEKVMALKSIGDLDTPESVAFMKKVATQPRDRDGMITDIVDLHR